MTDIAEQIRARQAEAAREAAQHEKPLLHEAAGILAEMAAMTRRLDELRPQVLNSFVPTHLQLLVQSRDSAAKAVATALAAVEATVSGDLVVAGSIRNAG